MKMTLVSTLFRSGQKALATEKGKQWKRLCIGLLVFPLLVWTLTKAAPKTVGPDFLGLQLKLLVLFAAVAATLTTFPKLQPALGEFWKKLANQDQSLETSQRLYLRVVLIALVLLLLTWLSPGPSLAPLVGAFGAFCIFVALYDALRWYKTISEHALGKAALGVGFAAASTLAYALARQEIAGVAHVVPTNFQHTTILVSIMTIPFLVVVAGGALFGTCMLVYSVAVPLQMFAHNIAPGMTRWLFAGTLKNGSMKFPVLTRFFQIFFYATLGASVYNLGRPSMTRYETTLQKFAPAAVFSLDMYEGRECPLNQGEKLAALGDAKFLVGRRDKAGNIEFIGPIKCDELPTRAPIP